MKTLIISAVAALCLTGCTTTGSLAALHAANISADAYCALDPAARAEFRRKLDISVPIIKCETAE